VRTSNFKFPSKLGVLYSLQRFIRRFVFYARVAFPTMNILADVDSSYFASQKALVRFCTWYKPTHFIHPQAIRDKKEAEYRKASFIRFLKSRSVCVIFYTCEFIKEKTPFSTNRTFSVHIPSTHAILHGIHNISNTSPIWGRRRNTHLNHSNTHSPYLDPRILQSTQRKRCGVGNWNVSTRRNLRRRNLGEWWNCDHRFCDEVHTSHLLKCDNIRLPRWQIVALEA